MEEQKYLITDHTFIRFSIIGVVSNVINFTLYSLTYLIFVNIIISSLIGYFFGILTSYYFGRLWVFKVDNNFTLSEIIRFISVYVIGGLGMTIIIFYLDHYLNFDYRLSWVVGALFAITNNYLGSKHLVFSKKDI
jgi:putative flippase GtrA